MSRKVWRSLVWARVVLALVMVVAVICKAWPVFTVAVVGYAGLMAWAWRKA